RELRDTLSARGSPGRAPGRGVGRSRRRGGLVGFRRHPSQPRGRDVTLLLILVLTTFVLFAIFLGGSIVAQGYLYQAPADRLPVRAIAAAVLVGAFLTIWTLIDKRSPRKYDTFFEFAPYETSTFDEMEAVRWVSADPRGSKMTVDESG